MTTSATVSPSFGPATVSEKNSRALQGPLKRQTRENVTIVGQPGQLPELIKLVKHFSFTSLHTC